MTLTLELRQVTQVHGSGRVQVDALVDANLLVEPGALVAVMGPSGSGKTSLLSLAGGLETPTSGEVFVEGVSLSSLSLGELARLRRRRIGYVFQQFNLIEGLTALENVSIPMELDGVARREASSTAMQALELLGLSELSRRFPDELSGGEQQRVAIARAPWLVTVSCCWPTNQRELSTPSPARAFSDSCVITVNAVELASSSRTMRA